MKYFPTHRIADALAHAAAGGQSLHVMTGAWGRTDHLPTAPRVFRRSGIFAHLFDQDRGRLEATARRLGVRFVSVHNAGLPGQHVDLVGRPLVRAQRLCAAARKQEEITVEEKQP